MRYTTAALIVVLLPAASFAQSPPPRVSGTVGVTAMSPGPGVQLRETLKGLGFDARTPSGPTPYSRNTFHATGQVHVRFAGRQSIGAYLGGAEGFTIGFQPLPSERPSREGGHLTATYVIDSSGLLYSWWLTRYVRVGAGPSYHSTRFDLNGDGRGADLGRERVLGWTSDFNLHAPIPGRPGAIVELGMQHRHAGARDVGPVPVGVQPSGQPSQTVLWPRTHVDFTHWAFTVSVGLGF